MYLDAKVCQRNVASLRFAFSLSSVKHKPLITFVRIITFDNFPKISALMAELCPTPYQ